ncbi:MAG: DUF6876 family protein [Candidatus Paceibacterota bacterium]|jgi:hypothetical protein
MKGSLTNLNDSFNHFIGTEHYYSHLIRTCVFTDGVKAMADQYQAYWLIDIIVSYQMTKRIKCIPFQIWTITSAQGKAIVEMRQDTGRPVLVRQQIPFTDFPKGSLQLYCIDDSEYKVILLPSEY